MHRRNHPNLVTVFTLKNTLSKKPKAKLLGKATIEETHACIEQIACKEAPHKKFDFGFGDTNGVGACSLWGKRYTQEDVLGGTKLSKLASQFTHKEWKAVLENTFSRVEKLINQELSGSCCCTAIVVGNTIITANLGDSESILVTLSDNNDEQVATARRLNALHNGKNPDEIKRIDRTGAGFIGNNNYIYSYANPVGLLPSRSFGDNQLNTKGQLISHKPQITVDRADGLSYLILACDGFREGLRYIDRSEERQNELIAQKIQSYTDKYLFTETMAKNLAYLSYRAGSKDNISVIVIPVTNIELDTNKEPLCYFIADGHSGIDASHALAKYFIPTLEEEIEKHLLESKGHNHNELAKNKIAPR